MKQKAELLSPCGNWDCVIAAVNAGADAVYLGGQMFNARAYASNFDNETLEKVCGLCHSFGVKVYVTVNTLYKDEEFPVLLPFIDELYAMGVDGLIMQDLGAIRLVRKYWPDMNIHASTQLTANSTEDVRAFESLGIKTAVLSRELNLKEIREIAGATGVRIETFIHGALCVSYSGQCLMSSVLGNRSGNRGKCAQNCRLNYELINAGKTIAKGHLLSAKDICTLSLLPELLDSGAVSLKIEGRMKTPEYVAGVTGIYRKYLDLYYSGEEYKVDPEDIRILQQLFNRGSFSTGYLKTHSGSSMMCPTHPRAWGVKAGQVLSADPKSRHAVVRFSKEMVPGDGIEIRTDQEEGSGCYIEQPCRAGQSLKIRVEGPAAKGQEVWQTYDKRLMDSLKPRYETILRKQPIRMSITLLRNQPSVLTVIRDGMEVRICGEIPLEANNQPLTAESVREQLSKLGHTIYRAETIDTELDEGLYLNKSALNALKNRAVDELTQQTIAAAKRQPRHITAAKPRSIPAPDRKSITVGIRTKEQFQAALTHPAVSVICAELNSDLFSDPDEIIASARKAGKKIFIRLPRIFRSYVQQNIAPMMELCRKSDIDGWLICNTGHVQAVKDSGKELMLDYTGNVLNSHAVEFWKDLGIGTITISPEMSRDEINALSDRSCTEILAYGYLPLMVTHQCPVGNFAGGKKDRMHCSCFGHAGDFTLRCGKETFRLDTDCPNCICTITTPDPLDIREDVNRFKVRSIRLDFTTESGKNTSRIIGEYERILASGKMPSSPVPNIYDKSVL